MSQRSDINSTIQPEAAGRRLALPGVPGGAYAWRGSLLEAAVPLAECWPRASDA